MFPTHLRFGFENVQKCECAKFRTLAHVRNVCDFCETTEVCAIICKKMCSAKVHKYGCAKFCTLAQVQNVYDVCAGAEDSPHKLEMLRLTDLGTKKVQNLKL